MQTSESVYVLVEVLEGVTVEQREGVRDVVWGYMQGRGKDEDGALHRRLQFAPVRDDGMAVVVEGVFDLDEFGVEVFQAVVADEYGVGAQKVGYLSEVVNFGAVGSFQVTFFRSAVGCLRFIGFGMGEGVTGRDESGRACREYLALYRELWVGDEG